MCIGLSARTLGLKNGCEGQRLPISVSNMRYEVYQDQMQMKEGDSIQLGEVFMANLF